MIPGKVFLAILVQNRIYNISLETAEKVNLEKK